MAIYKAVMDGFCEGQAIKNMLYYRTGVGIDIAGLTLGGTEDLARGIQAMVWPSMKTLLPDNYTLLSITVYAYHDATYDLIYQNPFTLGVGESGSMSDHSSGTMACAIVKFDLEPTPLIVDGPKPPKRGYIAFGPLSAVLQTDAGSINRSTPYGAKWDSLTAALSSNVETLLPPAVFFPIRVHHDVILGLLKITSFADVGNAVMRDIFSFRRSRQPEI